MAEYIYELRSEGEIVGTGRFTSDDRYTAGDRLNLDRRIGRVRDVLPTSSGEIRLIVDVDTDGFGVSL